MSILKLLFCSYRRNMKIHEFNRIETLQIQFETIFQFKNIPLNYSVQHFSYEKYIDFNMTSSHPFQNINKSEQFLYCFL